LSQRHGRIVVWLVQMLPAMPSISAIIHGLGLARDMAVVQDGATIHSF
jgi:hypothetical protein